MVDQDIVTTRLSDLALRIRRVRTHAASSAEELAADQDALDLVSFNLMLAVQACLDVASHLIADEGWEPVTMSSEAFRRLHQHEVISEQTAHNLGLASGLRNVVAHEYANVQPRLIHGASVEGVADLERFAHEVGGWLARRLDLQGSEDD